MRKWVSSSAYRAAIDTIVNARKTAGLTQRELEQRLGQKHHGLIAKIEARERQVNIVEFVAIARAIGIDEAALFQDVLSKLPERLDV